ncbi:hypothetical protein BJV78DRAFT_1159147 [Lactifluus subvellereus]|nr:hypothetical protein BJV78DRAFT_1159147 [Lactifluus subvellereus]
MSPGAPSLLQVVMLVNSRGFVMNIGTAHVLVTINPPAQQRHSRLKASQKVEQVAGARRMKKPCRKMVSFYCGKCRVDGTDHKYDNCPSWRFCGFCNQHEHWGFDCLTPHFKCQPYCCGIHVGHQHMGAVCPMSGIMKNLDFGYEEEGSIVDLECVAMIYSEDLDWDSFLEPL